MTIGKRDALYPGYVLPSTTDVFHALRAEALLRTTPENVEDVMDALGRVAASGSDGTAAAGAGGEHLLTALERLLERFLIVYGEPASGAVPHEVTIAKSAIEAAKATASGSDLADERAKNDAAARLFERNAAEVARQFGTVDTKTGFLFFDDQDHADLHADLMQRAESRRALAQQAGAPADPIYQWREKPRGSYQPAWYDATKEEAYSRVDDFYEARTLYAAPAPAAQDERDELCEDTNCPHVGKTAAEHIEADSKDAARLDFMVQHEAWIAFSKDGESCRVFNRTVLGDAQPMPGWGAQHWRHDPRDAIDAAMSQAKMQGAVSREGGAQ